MHDGAGVPEPAERPNARGPQTGAGPGRRPLIVIPARFSASASALRFGASVVARRLSTAVFAAGGEPLVFHPDAPGGRIDDAVVGDRLWLADGVLLPGGGDLAAHWAGQRHHPSLYDVNEEQDAFDLAVARFALGAAIPLFAICRGSQVVNVVRGGDLVQDMEQTSRNHRHRRHEISVVPDSTLGTVVGSRAEISCYHHQCIDRLGDGLVAAAHADDGVIEAVMFPGHPGWYLGVQWHPEDLADSDPVQAELFRRFVVAAGGFAQARGEAVRQGAKDASTDADQDGRAGGRQTLAPDR